MKYIVAAVLIVMSACAPLSVERASPFRPASEHFLRVDNNGTEDVRIYLHPYHEVIGRCGSLRVCEVPLTRGEADDIAQGRVQVSYRRLAHHELIRMPFTNLYGLELYVGRFDSSSWLRPR